MEWLRVLIVDRSVHQFRGTRKIQDSIGTPPGRSWNKQSARADRREPRDAAPWITRFHSLDDPLDFDALGDLDQRRLGAKAEPEQLSEASVKGGDVPIGGWGVNARAPVTVAQ